MNVDPQVALAISARKEIENIISSKSEFHKMKLKVDDIVRGVPSRIREELILIRFNQKLASAISELNSEQRNVFITFLHVAHK